MGLSVRDFNAVKRFGINTTEELLARLPDFCEHAKGAARRVTEALHGRDLIPYKLGQWVEPVECGGEIQPEELKAGDFVIMGFPTESRDWRKVVMIRKIEDDTLHYLDGAGGYPHGRLGDRRVWRIHSEQEEDTSMNEETKPAVVVSEEYTKAVEADALVNAGMELMGSGLYQMCMGVKKMHDGKLYKEFGYQNFEDYCKSKGFTKQHGGRLIKIAEMAEAENGTSGFHFESLGFKKNYLLSLLEPEDRQELIATQNVDGMTVKELEAAKAEIDRLKQERDEAKATIETKDKQFRHAMESKNNELTEVKTGWKRRSDTLLTKIAALQKELEEAKAEPQEVAVEDTSRVEELEKQLAECRRQLEERPMVQEALPNDSDARRRGEYSAISNAMIDALDNLMDFLEDNDHCSNFSYFANRAKDKLREYNSRINDMLAKEEPTCQ